MNRFWVWVLRMMGWSLVGTFPKGTHIVVGAPHTSNWDFMYGLIALKAHRVRINYLIKREWVRFPLSIFFKATGALAVNRANPRDLTNVLQERLETIDDLKLLFTPEGTRSRVDRWKTGFWRVAMEAKLSVIPTYLDYKRKVAGVGPVIHLTGDLEKDLEQFERFYADKVARYRENFNQVFFKREDKKN